MDGGIVLWDLKECFRLKLIKIKSRYQSMMLGVYEVHDCTWLKALPRDSDIHN